MTRFLRSICGLVVLLSASMAAAQSAPAPADQPSRPATTTFFGDTGLWFVPTGEVLANGKVSFSGYRRGTNWVQGYTNVADFAGTFAIGLGNRTEVFGSFLVDTRIDRDVRPIFVNDPAFGGFIDRYPQVNQYWTGDHVGDLYLGAKFNLLSQFRRDAAAVAVRAMVKVPTGKVDVGVSTGKPDVSIDAIVSKEAATFVETSGYVGYEWRGKPDGFDTPGGAFRWGTGLTLPSRNAVRLVGEVNGFVPSSDVATTGTALIGIDSSRSLLTSSTENITRATLGVTVEKKGWFLGAGVSWNAPSRARSGVFTDDDDAFGDYYDVQFRIGYHPGVRVYSPPPPPPPPAPSAPTPVPVHTLSVKATCEPCSVEVGMTSTVTATVSDSIGCPVTVRWTAPSGSLAQPAERSTIWTAPQQDGRVPVTVNATCPSDNKTASDTITIAVVKPPVRTYTFEDVYFDFDRYSLRPEAIRVLDDAVTALNQDPTLRVTIEGHTCSIGTAEYNLALGDRRATAVRDYLAGRGIGAQRLQTVSYGEERPKFDNAREETRRLNRRAALVVRLQ